MANHKGRPSKVEVWGLADEIDELRSKGLSQQIINQTHTTTFNR